MTFEWFGICSACMCLTRTQGHSSQLVSGFHHVSLLSVTFIISTHL